MMDTKKYEPLLLRREEGESQLDFSHLFVFLSAYHYSETIMQDLRENLIDAVKLARKERRQQIVTLDGAMFLLVSQSGGIELCVPWKRYVLADVDTEPRHKKEHGSYCTKSTLLPDPKSGNRIRVYCGRPSGHDFECDFVRA